MIGVGRAERKKNDTLELKRERRGEGIRGKDAVKPELVSALRVRDGWNPRIICGLGGKLD